MIQSLRQAAVLLLIFFLSLSLSGVGALWAQQDPAAPNPATASIEGRVFASDRTTPVSGAVVRAVRGDGVQVYSSQPTDEKGRFSLNHLAPGSYDIVVEVADGVYLVERTLSVAEAKTYSLSLATVPAENVEKRVAAVDKPVKGYAWTLEGKSPGAGGFWRTPGGIAVIAGGVAGVAALIISSNNNKGSNSSP